MKKYLLTGLLSGSDGFLSVIYGGLVAFFFFSKVFDFGVYIQPESLHLGKT